VVVVVVLVLVSGMREWGGKWREEEEWRGRGWKEERRAAVAREITKAHETIYRGTLTALLAIAAQDGNFERGEITLVLEGASAVEAAPDAAFVRRALTVLRAELPTSRAAAVVAQLTGWRKADVYALALTDGGDPQQQAALPDSSVPQ
jgi:16S rRNA C1402 (ribose-2'-O) methylase RsmI